MSIICTGEKTLETERERAPTSLYDLRRSVGRNSSGQEQKFIYLTRATHGYRKHEILPMIQMRSLENQRFRGLGSVHRTS